MTTVSEQSVRKTLAEVVDPGSGAALSALATVSGLVIKDGNIGFSLEVDPAKGPSLEGLRKAAESAVLALPDVTSATAVLTAHRAGAPAQPQRSAQPERPAQQQGRMPSRPELPGIKSIVAVASGKGGVGKSTVATNLALALAGQGLEVGLLDADVYGPSLPRMMGINRKPESRDGKTLIPLENHNIKCMSIGFLVAEDTPTIWRGPMVMSALEQMLRDVEWGELDVLVVDMPPGTGDAQLTMAQRVPLAGAVIVSTPQDIALLDARKGLNMFRRVDVPVLGIIENMSYFLCPHCGERSDIFGHGGARQEADKLGVPFLGEVPLHLDIRVAGDGGTPIVAADPTGPHAAAFAQIAEKVAGAISGPSQRKAAPSIVFE
ncbi:MULTISPECIES: Mrp/NBP35 family ATP-binding protein [Thalassobaculum]|uniref:Iron-sulfur cluster carrier protein n=1 Tax=Thalassobaculum litoreum DSM 18839 TaxID=1123362 RepID=A0A8G2BFX4_9PROT|nr:MULTISPECIES: Mrp/NBP35 family ATP-binding protein [Thalassobaculum]SDF44104.1 ATP-binding protein involved in chromosome partitioning [Thalassobaculum litoreum DSM 18839]